MMAELDSRSNKLARQAESIGGGLAIRFQFEDGDGMDMDRKMSADNSTTTTTTIDVPEVCFVNILHYLSGNEIVNKVSLVCKAWLSASRLPVVCEDGADMSRLNLDTKLMNMTSFLKLLSRPQFATLKGLALPYNVKLGKNSFKRIAELLPDLETLDLGYYHADCNWSAKMNCTDADLVSTTIHFTNLTALHIDMSKVSSHGIEVVARTMGEKLVELKLHTDNIYGNYLSEQAMETISTSCPNLKNFSYRVGKHHYKKSSDGVTGDNVVRLVERCPQLQSLTLYEARNVEQSHFLQIARMVSSDLDKFPLRKIAANGYESEFNIKTLLAEYTFLDVEDKFASPRLEKGIVFWGNSRSSRGDVNYRD